MVLTGIIPIKTNCYDSIRKVGLNWISPHNFTGLEFLKFNNEIMKVTEFLWDYTNQLQ